MPETASIPAFPPADASAWPSAGTDPSRLAENQHAFAAALGRATDAAPDSADKARDAAEQFVTQTLILPLLKQLRSANTAAPPFAPTQVEKQFGALQDAELAHRIARATHFPLVDRLARDLLTRSGTQTQDLSALTAPPVSPPTIPGFLPGAARSATRR